MTRNLLISIKSFLAVSILLLSTGIGWGQFVEQSYGCGQTWYDPGGSGGNYGINQLYVYTICPSNPGEYVTVNFTGVNIEAGWDNMMVLNGSASNSPLIANFSGTSNQTFTSSASDGCLTFIFQSDYFNANNAGWTATVTCGTVAGTNTSICTDQNCLGGCVNYVCGTSSLTFNNLGEGAEELNAVNRGCLGPRGEGCAKWLFLNPVIPGTLSLNMTTNGGQDQDFAIWEGYAPSLDCPALTGAAPIRCNYAGMNNTGTGTGITEPYANNDIYHEDVIIITQAQIDAGIYFIMLVDTYNPGGACPSPTVTMDFTNTTPGLLSCEPIPLPTTLLEFTATRYENGSYLSWRTASEKDLSLFQIERSIDGENWSAIGVQSAAGNSVSELHYYFFDREALTDYKTYYYRLKIYDNDGTYVFSQIISINNSNSSENQISFLSPNPATSSVSFEYNGVNYDDLVHIQITNNIGQTVYVSAVSFSKNEYFSTIDISSLTDGVYFVSFVQSDEQISRQKLIINK
jgi:hypothetical protein